LKHDFTLRVFLVSIVSVTWSAFLFVVLQELQVTGFLVPIILYSLPVFLCCLLVGGVSDGGRSLLFGFSAGFLSSVLWMVVFVLLSSSESADYSLIGFFWLVFWFFFTFAGISGSWLHVFFKTHVGLDDSFY
jgi:hypothetical protein